MSLGKHRSLTFLPPEEGKDIRLEMEGDPATRERASTHSSSKMSCSCSCMLGGSAQGNLVEDASERASVHECDDPGSLSDCQSSQTGEPVEDLRAETPNLQDQTSRAESSAEAPSRSDGEPSWKTRHPFVFRRPVRPLEQDAWEPIRVAVEKYDGEMCKAWNGELDTILVFTGLFSAAVTAFCLESFQSLTQNQADTTNAFLLAISLQLANSSSPVANASIGNAFLPAKHEVHINVLYFISLALALSVSSVCILGKQWIREYEKDVVGTPCDAVRVRQMRYDSLEAWKVPQIIAALPVLLITALLLFFAGLLVQLWHASECTTAVCVSVVVALTALVHIVTNVAPAFCGSRHSRAAFVPFRSPQAWLFFVAYRRVQHWFHGIFETCAVFTAERSPLPSNWAELDLHVLEIEAKPWFDNHITSVHRSLRWVYRTFSTFKTMEHCVFRCLHSPQNLPHDLIKDTKHLVQYVFATKVDSAANPYAAWPKRSWYDASSRRQGHRNPWGRHQIELIIRTINGAIDNWIEDRELFTNQITSCCTMLVSEHGTPHGIFHPDHIGNFLPYQRNIELQVVHMLRRLFHALKSLPVSLPQRFWDKSLHLLALHSHSDNSLVMEAYDDVIRALPAVIRTRASISLGLYIIRTVSDSLPPTGLINSEHAFVEFDKVMFDLWNSEACVEDCTRKNLLGWKEQRLRYINRSPVKLPEDYFDCLNRPLPMLDSCTVPLPTYKRLLTKLGRLIWSVSRYTRTVIRL